MKKLLVLAGLACAVSVPIHADKITFHTGSSYDCKVLNFENGAFEVEMENGEVKKAPARSVKSISFEQVKLVETVQKEAPPEQVQDVAPDPPEEVPEYKKIKIKAGPTENVKITDSHDKKRFRKNSSKLIKCRVELFNGTKKPLPATMHTFQLKDSKQNSYSTGYLTTGENLTLFPRGEVNPGGTVAGWVMFEVSIGLLEQEDLYVKFDNTRWSNMYEVLLASDWFKVVR